MWWGGPFFLMNVRYGSSFGNVRGDLSFRNVLDDLELGRRRRTRALHLREREPPRAPWCDRRTIVLVATGVTLHLLLARNLLVPILRNKRTHQHLVRPQLLQIR